MEMIQMRCPQCGLHHPPLNPGVRCIMAKEKTSTGSEIDFNLLFGPLKNICIAQIEQKKITNWKNLFSKIIMDINGIIEKY